MHKFLRSAAALAAAAALAGCNDLTGGDLSNDPNRPSAVTANQLFVGFPGEPRMYGVTVRGRF